MPVESVLEDRERSGAERRLGDEMEQRTRNIAKLTHVFSSARKSWPAFLGKPPPQRNRSMTISAPGAGASTASVLVTADAIEGFDHVDIWMRHGAIPTVLDHLVHTVLKKNGTFIRTSQTEYDLMLFWRRFWSIFWVGSYK
jgi:hypothetical protein